MATSSPVKQYGNILQVKDYSLKSRTPVIPSTPSDPTNLTSSLSSSTEQKPAQEPTSTRQDVDEIQNASNASTLRRGRKGISGDLLGGSGSSTNGEKLHQNQREDDLNGLGERIRGLGIKLGVKGVQDEGIGHGGDDENSLPNQDPTLPGEPLGFPPVPKELQGLPLPVRLGLIEPPSTAKRLSKQIPRHPLGSRPTPRYSMGYYFCIAPPLQQPASYPNSVSSPLSPNANFDFFPSPPSPLPLKISNNRSASLFSDSASIATSSSASSDSNSNINLNSPTTTSTSRTTRNSSMPWSPHHYFKISRERVRGKMKEFKRHAYPASEVPYFIGYDEAALEADALIHTLMKEHIIQDHSSTKFAMNCLPSRVLDLGSGSGAWCLDAARDWTSTEFIGLDCVPIQTPLSVLNDPDLERRISWVVSNFLEELPFPDNSFDFVQMRFVGAGVPEDKWSDLLAEISRVLVEGGVLEIIDTNFAFYGTPSHMDSQTLEDLTGGKLSMTETREACEGLGKMKMFDEHDPNHAIQIAFERMWHRRSINLSPVTLIPSNLILQDLQSIAISTPRHIPVTTNPSGHHQAPMDGAPPLLNDPLVPDDVFHFLTQYNNDSNEPSWMEFADDLTRAMILIHQANTLLSCRDRVWEEAEKEKADELKRIEELHQTPTVNPTLHQEEVISTKPFIHPWVSKREFDHLLDSWHSQLLARANIPGLVETLLGWKDGEISSGLMAKDRNSGQRPRKMSVSTRDSFSSKSSSINHAHPTVRLREVMNQIDDSDYDLDSAYEELSSPTTSVSTKPGSRDSSKVSLLGIKDFGVWTARGN